MQATVRTCLSAEAVITRKPIVKSMHAVAAILAVKQWYYMQATIRTCLSAEAVITRKPIVKSMHAVATILAMKQWK